MHIYNQKCLSIGNEKKVHKRLLNMVDNRRSAYELSQMKKKLNEIKNPNVLQRMLTRSQVHELVMRASKEHVDISGYSIHEQYLIKDHARSLGLNIIDDLLSKGDLIAEENSDIDHPELGDEPEITKENPYYYTLQCKRGPGLSAKKTIPPNMKDVIYERDGAGNINFDKPYSYSSWLTPVLMNNTVNLNEDSKKRDYGKVLNGNFVHIPSASRQQHFSIANRVAKKHSLIAGNGGSSPDGWTWHHLREEYKMQLVHRTVHQQFGHNGGFYFW